MNLPPLPLLLALALPGPVVAQPVPAAMPPGTVLQAHVPQSSITQALALVSEAAATLAPAGARVEARPGTLDSRLRLAPCVHIAAFLVPGTAAWGRTRVGLRCENGPRRWTVYLPVTVQVWAPAVVPVGALAVGARLDATQLQLAEVDWAAAAPAPFANPAALVGRVLARSVPAGQALRVPDLQARLWFAAGDTVRVLASGPGFAISADGRAVSAGMDGQRVRVRIGENRVVEGLAVGPGAVQVGP